jgi:hypothetical protein
MAAFFANIQVRTGDQEAVVAAVERLLGRAGYTVEQEVYSGDRSVYISPAENGWVGVYDSACDGVTVGPLAWLAQGLSQQLEGVTLAWLVYDSSLLLYLLFQNGEVEDRYVSRPDYFPGAQRDDRPAATGPLGGDGQRLLEVTGVFGDGRPITRWLRRPDDFAQLTLRRVAAALGQRHAELGHEELEADLLAAIHLEDPDGFARLEFTRQAVGASQAHSQ